MLGIEVPSGAEAAQITGAMLKRGYIVLPSGVDGNIIALTPPLVLSKAQEEGAMNALEHCLNAPSCGE